MHAVRVLQQLLFLFTTLQLYVPFGLADHPGDTQEVGDECSMRSFDQLVPGVVTRMCPPPDSPTGCADGTPFTFLVRRGSDPTSAKKIMVDFMGGGACWDYGSCAGASSVQFQSVPAAMHLIAGMSSTQAGSLLTSTAGLSIDALSDEASSNGGIGNWTYIFVPYCTQDIHLGTCTSTYRSEGNAHRTLHHFGAHNTKSVIDWISASFPPTSGRGPPSSLAFVGCSAGAAAVIVTEAARASRRYAQASPPVHIVAVGDSPTNTLTESFVRGGLRRWGVGHALDELGVSVQNFSGSADLTSGVLTNAVGAVLDEYPGTAVAFYSARSDNTATSYWSRMGGVPAGQDAQSSWRRNMLSSFETMASRRNFRSFISGGNGHCSMAFDQALKDPLFRPWLDTLLNGTTGLPPSHSCGTSCTFSGVPGCDGVVGSRTLEDRCGQCNGSHTGCAGASDTPLCSCTTPDGVCSSNTAQDSTGGDLAGVVPRKYNNSIKVEVGEALLWILLLLGALAATLILLRTGRGGDVPKSTSGVQTQSEPASTAMRLRNTRTLVRKNLQIKRAQYRAVNCGCIPCTACCELLFPVVIIVLFAFLRGLNDPESTLGGWETLDEDFLLTTRSPAPFSEMTVNTQESSFMRNVLLPLHLRPRYKLALAVRNVEDLGHLHNFRKSISREWFPRQQLRVVPCLPTQSPRYSPPSNPLERTPLGTFDNPFDDHRRLDSAEQSRRRRLHNQNTPLSRNVADLAEHLTWESLQEDSEDWLPSCPRLQFNQNASWNCGDINTTSRTTCSTHVGCEWDGSSCVESGMFPQEALCCSRGNWTKRTNHTGRGGWIVDEPDWVGGWISSFVDVTMIVGDGTVEDLEKHITSDTYLTDKTPYVAAAIVFENVGTGTGNWEYSIRLNSSFVKDVPATDVGVVDYLSTEVDLEPTTRYIRSDGASFMALQLLVDRWLIRSRVPAAISVAQAIQENALQDLCQLDCPKLSAPLMWSPYRVVFSALPFAPTTKQDFYTFVSDWLALVFTIMYMYSMFNAAQTFGLEKESRMREALRMQGVGNCELVQSWVCSFGLQYFVTALSMAVASKLSLFPLADFSLLLFGYWLSLLAFMAFAFAMHTFFNKAKIGGLFTVVIFVASWPLWREVKTASTTDGLRLLAQLHPGTACCFLIQSLGLFEGAMQGLRYSTLFTPIDGSTFGEALLMLLLDTALYVALGAYFELVLPKEFGIRLQPWFCCTRAYWRQSSSQTLSQPIDVVQAIDTSSEHDGFEPADEASLELAAQGKCISIRGLRKEFVTPNGVLVAVQNLNMTMFEGQIFALLGRNGAGKTTTINMLSGLHSPTAGDALIYGRSIARDMVDIRRDMGCCFQHDVLYPTLTVAEHLHCFAELRGLSGICAEQAVLAAIEEVGLSHKQRVQSNSLSGGMKRKLSLAIALVGGPRVLFLDEPTSGLDPFSRRSIWDILQAANTGRCIVLTTHFLEEADLLGDRIGVMGGGQLLSCGSSIFLKKVFGHGYTLTLETTSDARFEHIQCFIEKYVPVSATLCHVAKETSFQLPMLSTQTFPSLFRALNQEKANIGVVNYGISVTTLESVFLQIVDAAQSQDSAGAAESIQTELPVEQYQPKQRASDMTIRGVCKWCRDVRAMYVKRFHHSRRDKSSIICSTLIPILSLILGLTFLKNSLEQDTMPSLPLDFVTSFGSDWMPEVPVLVEGGSSAASLAVRNIEGADLQPANGGVRSGAVFGVQYLNGCPVTGKGDQGRAAVDTDWDDGAWLPGCGATLLDYGSKNVSSLAGPTLALAESSYRQGLGSLRDQVIFGAMVTAGSAATATVSILINTTAYHAAPIFLNALSNGFAASESSTARHITVNNAPLPVTRSVDQLFDQLTSIFAVLLIVIAFSFVPGALVVFVVKEREAHHNCKHQQLISGASVSSYWVANFLFDASMSLISLSLAMIAVVAFDLPAFTGSVCNDWNSSQAWPNPLEQDFFAHHDAAGSVRNCSEVLASHPPDRGLLRHFGRCIPKTNVSGDVDCAVPIRGENYAWNLAMCTAVSVAPSEWAACMASAQCKSEIHEATEPGQSLAGSILTAFPPPATSLTSPALAALAAKLVQQQNNGVESQCELEVVYFPHRLCELKNEANARHKPPLPQMPCDATLRDVCAVSTDSCPASRTIGTLLLFGGFGLAIIPFSYLLAAAFDSHTTAQIVSVIVTFVVGLVLSIVSMILDTVPFEDTSFSSTNRDLKWLYRLCSPGFCLGNGLLEMAFSSFGLSLGNTAGAQLLAGPSDPLEWDQSGSDIVFLFCATPTLLGLVIIFDLVHDRRMSSVRHCRAVAASTMDEGNVDEDVDKEAQRVLSGGADGDAIRLVALHKVYHAPGQCLCQRVCKRTTGHCEVTAVKSLSFGVKSGEIFGFLGINGAGKTSTMNVLCGATAASSGAAYLLGCDVQTQRTEIRSQLGYCPQHDALIDLLTVREHLVLFARIKGIARSSLASVVEATLHEMNLGAFEHKLASQLSGGNKRKLSVAIATIAQPPLIILDEPSTGMDPQTRRCMWTVIQRLSNAGGGSCTVLLTTHSMEECEALCSRIGIMVSGRLRCLGTAQHIKNRFGRGYQLEISMKRCDAKGHVKMEEWVAQHFVGTHLLENHGSRMRFEIPSKEQTLADIFEQVEAVSSTGSLNIEHYSVSQTSLEQIFNSFASQQDQLKNATADGSSLDPDEADKDAWPPTVENLDPTEKPNLPARQLAREIHPHCPTESV